MKKTYINLFGIIFIYPTGLHFSVVHWQVPAVTLVQLVTPVIHHGLPLWGHWLQWCQNGTATISLPLLVHAQIQRPIFIDFHIRILSK